jgi:hypothetical protein
MLNVTHRRRPLSRLSPDILSPGRSSSRHPTPLGPGQLRPNRSPTVRGTRGQPTSGYPPRRLFCARASFQRQQGRARRLHRHGTSSATYLPIHAHATRGRQTMPLTTVLISIRLHPVGPTPRRATLRDVVVVHDAVVCSKLLRRNLVDWWVDAPPPGSPRPWVGRVPSGRGEATVLPSPAHRTDALWAGLGVRAFEGPGGAGRSVAGEGRYAGSEDRYARSKDC